MRGAARDSEAAAGAGGDGPDLALDAADYKALRAEQKKRRDSGDVKQLGIGVPLYQSHGVASKQYIQLAGDAAEGVRLPAAAAARQATPAHHAAPARVSVNRVPRSSGPARS